MGRVVNGQGGQIEVVYQRLRFLLKLLLTPQTQVKMHYLRLYYYRSRTHVILYAEVMPLNRRTFFYRFHHLVEDLFPRLYFFIAAQIAKLSCLLVPDGSVVMTSISGT